LLEASFLIAASTLAGAISAAVILTRISRRSKTSSLKKKHERLRKPFSTTKAELQSLLFEKSLLSQSITRVYEASYEGKIDSIERDRLLLKYKQQLDSYDKKIADLQSVVDITELVDMRNGLVSLLEGRITTIDQKLAEISNKYGISTSDIIDSSPKSDRQAIVSKPEEEKKENSQKLKENDDDRHQLDVTNEEVMAASVRGGDQKDQKKHNDKEKIKTEEKTIDELQKEIMHALSRLEQVDPDPDNRYENYEPSVDRKRDALSSF
jgi:chromosome segregation ATPase